MNVIIEGPDCSGKSTLIQTIFSQNCVIHNGVYRSPNMAFKVYMDQIPSTRLAIRAPYLVWDRQYISEQIYGPIYRNAGLSAEQVDKIESKHREIQTVVILCNPGRDVILSAWSERRKKGEEYIEQRDYFERIVDKYLNEFDTVCSLPFFEFNYLEDDITEVVSRILQFREVAYAK